MAAAALLRMCSKSEKDDYTLMTWSDVNDKYPDILLAKGGTYALQDMECMYYDPYAPKSVIYVDGEYEAQLDQFFTDPAITGSRKFAFLFDCDVTIITFNKTDEDMIISLDQNGCGIDEDVWKTISYEKPTITRTLSDIDDFDEFGMFNHVIEIMCS